MPHITATCELAQQPQSHRVALPNVCGSGDLLGTNGVHNTAQFRHVPRHAGDGFAVHHQRRLVGCG